MRQTVQPAYLMLNKTNQIFSSINIAVALLCQQMVATAFQNHYFSFSEELLLIEFSPSKNLHNVGQSLEFR